MTDLIDKYTKGQLSPDEIPALREIDDATLSKAMAKDWETGTAECGEICRSTLDRMKNNIDKKIGGRQSILFWLTSVAAVLLPLLIGTTIFLFIQNRNLSSNLTAFSTGPGKQAAITLPDGSRITLNSESELKYTTGEFNRGNREIAFNGEGFFEIAPDASRPFIINTEKMSVTVLGTVFCLQVRNFRASSELSLEEGKVLVKSLMNGQEAYLQPNQRLTMDNASGVLRITSDANIKDKSSWAKGEIIFHGERFSKVVERIEDVFGVRISVKGDIDPDDIFSGTITTNNIHDALLVLEKSFHLSAVINDRKVVLSKN